VPLGRRMRILKLRIDPSGKSHASASEPNERPSNPLGRA
jgi:hypothetical protein